MLFQHKPDSRPVFEPLVFFAVAVIFAILSASNPVVGLTGLGVISIIAAFFIETRREQIWAEYKKAYKKKKHIHGALREPKYLYYALNVYVLWPFIALIGCACVIAAYNI